MSLQDFINDENSEIAGLKEAEVVALRLYTTPAFQQINNPLRDMERITGGAPHPLPVTVMLIASGIKKLRSVHADKDVATQTVVLWRGMKNIKPTDKFAEEGGTEVCMYVCFFFLYVCMYVCCYYMHACMYVYMVTQTVVVLCRGMKNIKPTDKFAEKVNTEVCMYVCFFFLYVCMYVCMLLEYQAYG
jgi:hypothetical protein